MLSSKEQIGKLDRRVTFQSKIVGENESNEDEETGWENIDTNPTVWASKNERNGNEAYRADKLTDYLNVVFICRYRNDITPKHRLVCDGIPYNILSVTEISRRRYMAVDCESGGEFIGAVVTEEIGGFSSGFSSAFDT
jgi:SPP1 family predicted phage head-tail adaptor